MQIEFLQSYDDSVLELPQSDQKRVIRSISGLLEAIQTGKRPQGLGIRRLRKDIWECRAGLKIRILFELKDDRLSFIFSGSHDQIQRFIK